MKDMTTDSDTLCVNTLSNMLEGDDDIEVSESAFSGYPRNFIKTLQYIIDERDGQQQAALIMLSLNNMPMMISGFGHKATEEALQALLFSLKAFLKDSGVVTIKRVQKDQVAIIIDNGKYECLDAMARSIVSHTKRFGHTSKYGTIHILLSAYGVALPSHSVNADDLMNQAYVALKSETDIIGGEFEPVPVDSTNSRQEMNMVSYITNAIKDNQFCLAYQPIIESRTGSISHYEALLRVVRPNQELTTAGPLIPVAERMGLIDIIDDLVLDMVVEELLRSPDLKLAFNVSNLTTNSSVWLKKLASIAKEHPDVLSRMMVEITETAVHLDLRRTAYFVAAVQSYGAQVALDDFGSGYTSFRQLKSLSVDIIKIDGVFVKDLVDNHDNRLFIKTMLDFTNGFGLKTVAEFVETGETAKLLMELGVEYMQGYYFGFPDVKKTW